MWLLMIFFFFFFFFWVSIMLILRVWLLRKLCDCQNAFVWFVTTRTQLCRYCLLWAQRNLMTLKCVYKVKGPILIRLRTLSPIQCRTSQTPLFRYNFLVVSHGITGPNKKTPLIRPNKQTLLIRPNNPHTEIKGQL